MLDAPLDPRRVSQRQGSGGKSLSFLQSHDVKRTANRIFGYDGWSYTVDELVCLGEEPYKSSKGKEGVRVGYRATVTVQIGEVRRGDTGYGDAVEYQGSRITPHELASKEAVSDATKRCLASWGDQFGLVLYGDDPMRGSQQHAAPPSATPPARSDRATDEQWQQISTICADLVKVIGDHDQAIAVYNAIRTGPELDAQNPDALTENEAALFISFLTQRVADGAAVPS
jgi:DNA recombination protein Rad52